MAPPITLTITLSAEAAARLQALAEEQHRPLKDVAQEILETALQDDLDEREEDTPDEEIEASLRRLL
ncbi:hypothetical protein HC776_02065 [bacterium]|nr:hypothetical protein [bacterium]